MLRISRDNMKQCEYIEGAEARENFEEGMKALFKVPKEKVAKVWKKRNVASQPEKAEKPKRADED
jgi:hypothetical protein